MKWWGWAIVGFVGTGLAMSAYKRYLYRGYGWGNGDLPPLREGRVEPLDCNTLRIVDDDEFMGWLSAVSGTIAPGVSDERYASELMASIHNCPYPPPSPNAWRLTFEDGTVMDWPTFVAFAGTARAWNAALRRAKEALGAGATADDLADMAYPELFPDCPTRLEPDDPSHRECIDSWVALRNAARTYV